MENNKPKRQRARKSDGQFKGDNPATPDLNEAWEPVEVERSMRDYSVQKRIDGPSMNTAGKYSKKPKIRPGFGNQEIITS